VINSNIHGVLILENELTYEFIKNMNQELKNNNP